MVEANLSSQERKYFICSEGNEVKLPSQWNTAFYMSESPFVAPERHISFKQHSPKHDCCANCSQQNHQGQERLNKSQKQQNTHEN